VDALDKTKLIDLLREREAAFVRVWECEQQINRVLGVPYPFPPPPPLPCLGKRKRSRRTTAKRAATAVPSLRRLQGKRENAYHVHYELDGVHADTFQTDTELIRRLLATEIPGFRILRVDTVEFRAPDDWQTVDRLVD
jgi:hypothetical protein